VSNTRQFSEIKCIRFVLISSSYSRTLKGCEKYLFVANALIAGKVSVIPSLEISYLDSDRVKLTVSGEICYLLSGRMSMILHVCGVKFKI
jgi:hypothetical protein